MRIAMLPLLVIATSAWAAEAPAYKVEYREVKGSNCLQPTRNAPDVTLEDFRDAERRWLDEHHPEWATKDLRTKNRSARVEPLSDDEPAFRVVDKDVMDVELPDRSTRSICFDIKLKQPKTETP